MTTLLPIVAALASLAASDDYQQKADAASWEWDQHFEPSLAVSLCLAQQYTITVTRPKDTFGQLTIRIVLDEKHDVSWNGHPNTPFLIGDKVLYCADFDPSSDGCAVVAYDLAKNKQLWRTNLQALGRIEHTEYRNAVQMTYFDGGTLRIFGDESAGRYVEYVDRESGKTLAHKIFKGPGGGRPMQEIGLVAATQGASAGAPAAGKRPDYQKLADATSWEYHAERADVLYSALKAPKEYTIEVIKPKLGTDGAAIRVVRDGKTQFTLPVYTSFVIDDGVLFYADYFQGSEGCAIVGYDLKQQKQLWKTHLQGIERFVPHSGYANEVYIEPVGDTILVHGNEGAGKYIEYVDRKTGETVGHKVFKDD